MEINNAPTFLLSEYNKEHHLHAKNALCDDEAIGTNVSLFSIISHIQNEAIHYSNLFNNDEDEKLNIFSNTVNDVANVLFLH